MLVPASMASSRISGCARENTGSSRISVDRNRYQITELKDASPSAMPSRRVATASATLSSSRVAVAAVARRRMSTAKGFGSSR